jgi:hypothetical protein
MERVSAVNKKNSVFESVFLKKGHFFLTSLILFVPKFSIDILIHFKHCKKNYGISISEMKTDNKK